MLTVKLIGGDRVVARLEGLPPRLMGVLKSEVSRLAITLLRMVKSQKLSGQVLRNVTGTLRRKVNQRVVSDERAVVGQVGVKLSYAAAQDYGFDGEVQVKEHLRQVKQAWGKALSTPVTATVRGFTRHMRLPERSFLRSALREMGPEIAQGLQAAVRKAVAK